MSILQMTHGYMVLAFGGVGELKKLAEQVSSDGFHVLDR